MSLKFKISDFKFQKFRNFLDKIPESPCREKFYTL